jgi:hypothetical protein
VRNEKRQRSHATAKPTAAVRAQRGLTAAHNLAIYVSQKPRVGPKAVVVSGFARSAPKGTLQSKMGQSKMGDEKALRKVLGTLPGSRPARRGELARREQG